MIEHGEAGSVSGSDKRTDKGKKEERGKESVHV